MLDGGLAEEESPGGQIVNYVPVCVLDELAGEGELADDGPLQVHVLDEEQVVVAAGLEVVIAEGGSDVDDSRTFVERDEVGSDDRVPCRTIVAIGTLRGPSGRR